MANSSVKQAPDLETTTDEGQILAALRRGDESTFLSLVEKYHSTMMRIAVSYVRDPAIGEEIVQDAWLGVLNGIHRFEGRSSLKTWIFSILTNLARTRRYRDSRSIPFSELSLFDEEEDDPVIEPERFLPPDHPHWPDHWADPPKPWMIPPEEQLLNQEVMANIRNAINDLPASQQAVITLRDIEGWSSEEVCNILDLSETNQRVLLHRARSKVRRALELYFASEANR